MKRPRNDFLLVGLSLFIVTGFLGWWLLTRRDAVPEETWKLPKLAKVDVSDRELAEIIANLVETETWFNSRKHGRIEYEVTVTKSARRYAADLAEANASFPDADNSEASQPTLRPVWQIKHTLSFDHPRVASKQTGTLGEHSAWWDEEKLTGYVDHGTKQQPNYYMKSTIDQMPAFGGWFPILGTPSIWFANAAGTGYYHTWEQEPPTLAGGLRFADRDCLVLRDNHKHWIVGRYDRRVYGAYTHHALETFANHRELAPGVHWPMTSTRKRFSKGLLEWTDQITVTAFDEAVDASRFALELKAGVPMSDLREETPVNYVIDPDRTKQELDAIYADARADNARVAEDRRRAKELVGKPAPELGNGTWLNGGPVDLSSGEKPVTIGFSHTACAPCEDMLAMFAQRQDAENLQLLLVYSASDSRDAVEAKLKRFKLACPTFIPNSDETSHGRVFEDFRVSGFPTIVDVDSNGTITSHRIGTLMQD